MKTCRIELLEVEAAKKAAEAVEMIPAFAELNIFRVLLHRPKTAKALSDLLVSMLFGACSPSAPASPPAASSSAGPTNSLCLLRALCVKCFLGPCCFRYSGLRTSHSPLSSAHGSACRLPACRSGRWRAGRLAEGCPAVFGGLRLRRDSRLGKNKGFSP